jgi:uroporphyrinogen-III synthase
MAKYKVLSTKKLDHSLVEKASENGIDITEHEAIHIKPILTVEQLKELNVLFEGSESRHIIFTSNNAVEILADQLKLAGLAPINWKIFCIEGRTCETVISLFPHIRILATAAYGKLLANKILEHEVNEVYFFSGNIRRDELPEILKKAGIRFNETVVYETILNPVKLEEEYDAVLFFSPSAVESFFVKNEMKPETICFSIGETTSNCIRNYTRNNIIISQVPTQQKMIEEVLKHFCVEINN